MKVFVVLCLVFGVALSALTDEQRATLLGYHNDCIKETGVDEELTIQAMAGNFADDEKFKKHLFCMSKKLGFQNDDGEMQPEVLKEKLTWVIDDPVKVEKITSQCLIQKDTPENTAFEDMQCFYKIKHSD